MQTGQDRSPILVTQKIEETTLLKPVNDPPNTEGKCGLVAIGQRRLDWIQKHVDLSHSRGYLISIVIS